MLLSLSSSLGTQLSKSDRVAIECAPTISIDDRRLSGPYAAVVVDPHTILIPGWMDQQAAPLTGHVRLVVHGAALVVTAQVTQLHQHHGLVGMGSTTVLRVLSVEHR